ncbi:site-specific DNA-methyltransferase, partial [Klebsiella pneumoniae]|nr:site-specific DNA-methyltransferase [Klebsiella pneumoniae]
AGIDLDEATRILDFTVKGSSSHSAWLTFIYPRLYIARELMREDGTIFISIDDNEFSQLKLVCDEIFGEQNHIGDIVWKNVTDNNPSNIAVEHEYIVVYAKNKELIETEWKSNISDVKDLLVEIGDSLINDIKDNDKLQEEYSKWFRENKSQLWPLENYKFIDRKGVYSGERGVHNPGKEG